MASAVRTPNAGRRYEVQSRFRVGQLTSRTCRVNIVRFKNTAYIDTDADNNNKIHTNSTRRIARTRYLRTMCSGLAAAPLPSSAFTRHPPSHSHPWTAALPGAHIAHNHDTSSKPKQEKEQQTHTQKETKQKTIAQKSARCHPHHHLQNQRL